MDNPANPIYISYNGNTVGINRNMRENGQWVQTLFTCGDLIQAAKTTLSPLLDSVSVAHLTLKLPAGKSTTLEDGTVIDSNISLRPGLPLAVVCPLGTDDSAPFIIESTQLQQQGSSSSSSIRSGESGISSRSTRPSNTPFARCANLRDSYKCVICDEKPTEGAHIIPYKNHFMPEFAQYCHHPPLGPDDIRNAMALCPTHHTRFDKVFRKNIPNIVDDCPFTIIYTDSRYYYAEIDDRLVGSLKTGKELSFGVNPDFWPSPVFLKYHNDIFLQKMKAAGESKQLEKEDSDDTLLLAEEKYKYLLDDEWENEQANTIKEFQSARIN